MSYDPNINTSLVIGIPTRSKPGGISSSVPFQWAIGLATMNPPINTSYEIVAVNGTHIDLQRNMLVSEAIKRKAKYMFFLDDDVEAPRNAIRRLIYDLEQSDAMVASGIYCTKEDPPTPLVFKTDDEGPFWKWRIGEVFECSSVGAGCLMIKMELFKHLEPPYFKIIDERANGDVFRYQVGEDIYFCEQVRKAGFKIIADGGILCTHWDEQRGIPYNLPETSYPMQQFKGQ